jgi:hypothetical protein
VIGRVLRRRAAGCGLAVALAVLAALPAGGTAAGILNLREGAADARTADRIRAVNSWWERQHPGQTPCRTCEIRPPGSSLVWTYYRRQGYFPNWVRAARDLLRRERAGEVAGYRAGVEEVVSYSARRRSPDGLVFRVNESPYLSPDSTRPPWRDAMGQGLILTLIVPTIASDSTSAERDRAFTLASEYLNSFAVHWRDGGVAATGTAGGGWYLEYATERGDRARVLNGFMQSLVSLDRFAGQADTLAADPRWAGLRDRAREYVRLGALELHAHLDRYDFGGGLSRYSLAKPDAAPAVYQVYHRQLLLRLRDVPYLPQEWRDHYEDVRVLWGGKTTDASLVPGWAAPAGVIALALAALLALRRRAVVRRRRQRASSGPVPESGRPG